MAASACSTARSPRAWMAAWWPAAWMAPTMAFSLGLREPEVAGAKDRVLVADRRGATEPPSA